MFLDTSDKLKIAASWQSVPKSKGCLLLLHMMPATKESWRNFAEFMVGKKYSSLAIDLRGHGQSTGGPGSYKLYLPEDHQKSSLDIDAAINFLRKEKFKKKDIVLVGASIGANLAIEYITKHKDLKKVVALSAGLDYYGVNAEEAIQKLDSDQKIFLISAEDDNRVRGNAEMNEALNGLVPEGVTSKLSISKTSGHGTDILSGNTELMEEIAEFIEG
jgi:pimeloyl-ACP methyl ester carboxylesterase